MYVCFQNFACSVILCSTINGLHLVINNVLYCSYYFVSLYTWIYECITYCSQTVVCFLLCMYVHMCVCSYNMLTYVYILYTYYVCAYVCIFTHVYVYVCCTYSDWQFFNINKCLGGKVPLFSKHNLSMVFRKEPCGNPPKASFLHLRFGIMSWSSIWP